MSLVYWALRRVLELVLLVLGPCSFWAAWVFFLRRK